MRWLYLGILGLLPGCQFLYPPMPEEAIPLADMDEPLELIQEPDDEAARVRLDAGAFTGLYVAEAAESLDELSEDGPGIVVSRVVENSPADRAGLLKDDLILSVRVNDDPTAVEPGWPSQWRQLELDAVPGDVMHVEYERAAAERATSLTAVARVRPAPRTPAVRFREEEKVGVVLRTATEVEARHAGLPPGGGAVVVGLSRRSPWRAAGVQFEDLIVAVDEAPVGDPQAVLAAIAAAPTDSSLTLHVKRGDEDLALSAAVSERTGQLTGFTIPLLFSHESDRGTSDTSLLFGLLGYKSTAVAWEFRLLWLIRFNGGESDQLQDVEDKTP